MQQTNLAKGVRRPITGCIEAVVLNSNTTARFILTMQDWQITRAGALLRDLFCVHECQRECA